MNEITPVAREPRQRKPDWIRVKAPTSAGFAETRALMRSKSLTTVCEEAACPNIGECWSKKHATVMILGDTCTRACAFCNVKTGMPRAVDPMEPQNVADAAAQMGLQHIVVTSVDRDDLPDGGAKQFVRVIEAIRNANPTTTIEILTPDFRNKHEAAVEAIVAARPDVYNHNLETVPRLYPTIRPGARYYASLRLLESVKKLDPSIFTKSGVMLGLGEEVLEINVTPDRGYCFSARGIARELSHSLNVPFRAFTTDAGVDVLSFGGTKNGLLGAEAIVVPTLIPVV